MGAQKALLIFYLDFLFPARQSDDYHNFHHRFIYPVYSV